MITQMDQIDRFIQASSILSESESTRLETIRTAKKELDDTIKKIRGINKRLMAEKDVIQRHNLILARNDCINRFDSLQKTLRIGLDEFKAIDIHGYRMFMAYKKILEVMIDDIKKCEEHLTLYQKISNI